MTATAQASSDQSELARLVRELEEAELYEQKLRGLVVAIRDQLAAGNVERALSMCNEMLNEIDSATDVVVPGAECQGAGELTRWRRWRRVRRRSIIARFFDNRPSACAQYAAESTQAFQLPRRYRQSVSASST